MPALFVFLAKFSTWGMFVWQILMLPLALASRWTRVAVIVWGLIFFMFSASVLAIKALGHYEYVLWALVFANVLRRWLSAAVGWLDRCGPLLAAPLHPPWRSPLPDRSGLAGAVTLGFIVFATGYLARFPYIERLGNGAVAQASRQWLGQAPLAGGMGPIDVFNELDLRVYRNGLIIRLERPDGSAEIVDWAKVWTSESQGSRITVQARMLALQPVTCGTDMTPLILELLSQARPGEARLGTRVILDWLQYSRPDVEDFRAFRYASPAPDIICRVSAALGNAVTARVIFTQEGRRQLARLGLPLSLSDEQVAVATRFPCEAEVRVGAFWFDNGTDAPRTPDQTAAVLAMFSAREAGPYACFGAFQRLRAALDLDNLPRAVLPRATCGPDLAAAEAYAATLAGTELRGRARDLLEAASRARVTGDSAGCVVQTIELRRLALGPTDSQ